MTTLNWLIVAGAAVLAATSLLAALDAERRYRARQRDSAAFTAEEQPKELDETEDVSDLLAKLEASVKARSARGIRAHRISAVRIRASAEAQHRLLDGAKLDHSTIRITNSSRTKANRLTFRVFTRLRSDDTTRRVSINVEGIDVDYEDLKPLIAENLTPATTESSNGRLEVEDR
jgi:hypothetical protein